MWDILVVWSVFAIIGLCIWPVVAMMDRKKETAKRKEKNEHLAQKIRQGMK